MPQTLNFVHPSQMTAAQRAKALADVHARAARAYAKVGDKRNSASAHRAEKAARSAA